MYYVNLRVRLASGPSLRLPARRLPASCSPAPRAIVGLDIVPAGAFGDSATITVSIPDSNDFIVDLDIQPASLNHFTQLVELRLKCSNKGRTSTTPAAWWFNPADSLWYGLTGSQYDSGGGDVRVQLRHFSRYGAGGKAGW